MEHIRTLKYELNGKTVYSCSYRNLAGEDVPIRAAFDFPLSQVTPEVDGKCLRWLKQRIMPIMAEHLIFDLETIFEGPVEAKTEGPALKTLDSGKVGAD